MRGEEKTKQEKGNAGTTFREGRPGLRSHLEAFWIQLCCRAWWIQVAQQ